jgi:hypothetical protein
MLLPALCGLALGQSPGALTPTFITIDAPGALYGTWALSINSEGAIAGYYASYNGSSTYEGFLRSPSGAFTTFEPPGATLTLAYSINDAGAIAGYYAADNTYHGFVRSPRGAFATIDAPGAANGTVANSINDAGAITGFYLDANVVSHGYVRIKKPSCTGRMSAPVVTKSAL